MIRAGRVPSHAALRSELWSLWPRCSVTVSELDTTASPPYFLSHHSVRDTVDRCGLQFLEGSPDENFRTHGKHCGAGLACHTSCFGQEEAAGGAARHPQLRRAE